MTFWHKVNTRLYRSWFRLRNRPAAPPVPPLQVRTPDTPEILHIAWGRIGDAVLATGVLKHYRTAFAGCRIIYAGRPETEAIVAPYVDEFHPLGSAELARSYACIITDVHFFYGGTDALGGLVETLPAQRKFAYEGYHLGDGLAPIRRYPEGAEVVAALRKSPTGPRDRLHLLHDNAHYFAAVTQRLTGDAFTTDDLRPALEVKRGAELERFELDAKSYVVWQPSANNRKKDYPMRRWRRVIDAFPDTLFVALGHQGEPTGAVNVLDLRGRTTVAEAMSLIDSSALFLGPDSGLTHIATVLDRPTVCVSQSANLGYFFPYPREFGFDNLATVADQRYRECAGCFMTCSRESIVATYLRGAKCIREIDPAAVVVAVQEGLSQPTPA